MGARGTTANSGTGVLNTSANYSIVGQSVVSETPGLAPITTASLIDFGSGAGHVLHVGGFGYVNAVINSNTNSLAVQVDPNGQLFVANTTTALAAGSSLVLSGNTSGGTVTFASGTTAIPIVPQRIIGVALALVGFLLARR